MNAAASPGEHSLSQKALAGECLRLAIVGTGFGGQHLSWIAEAPGFEATALAYGSSADRAAELASQHGIGLVSPDAEELVRTADVDGIVIVSPPETHEAISSAALARGLLVICDKPLSSTLVAAQRMAKTAASAPSPALTLFQWRLHPLVVELERRIRDGAIGRPLQAALRFQHDFLAGEATNWPWRHRWSSCGGGALGDMGVHLFDLLNFLLPGDWSVQAASGATATRQRICRGETLPAETDDAAEVLLAEASSGGRAAISVSRIAVGMRRIEIIVTGSSGSAELRINPEDASGSLTIRRIGEDAPVALAAEGGAGNPYRALHDALLCGATGRFATFADGLRAQEMLEEAVAHVRRGASSSSGEESLNV
jgi:predicted dehydrogenase